MSQQQRSVHGTPPGHPPRVLFMPNEGDLNPANGQIGPRSAFDAMAADGTIRELKTYSFLAEFHAHKDAPRAQRELLEAVRGFQPDIIFWQHPSGFPVDSELLRQMRACGSDPTIGYHEGDPFDGFYKRMDAPVVALYKGCDVFFTTGLGGARRRFSSLNVHPHFHYSPSAFDLERVGAADTPLSYAERRYDAVMIGTIASSMKGFFKQPHSGKRVRLAKELAKLLGGRFAAFGRGWPEGTNAAGTIPFAQQASTIRSSRMSVMWDLYPDQSFYFSDRLPIALGSGVPFLTNDREGFSTLFRDCPGIFLAKTIEDMLDVALYLRSLPMEQIVALGEGGRRWAFENLEARVVFRRAFETCLRVHEGRR